MFVCMFLNFIYFFLGKHVSLYTSPLNASLVCERIHKNSDLYVYIAMQVYLYIFMYACNLYVRKYFYVYRNFVYVCKMHVFMLCMYFLCIQNNFVCVNTFIFLGKHVSLYTSPKTPPLFVNASMQHAFVYVYKYIYFFLGKHVSLRILQFANPQRYSNYVHVVLNRSSLQFVKLQA